jgi:steroid delta-isomerase-like uncharacterized protein
MPVDDNLKLIHDLYEAINKKDWDTAFGLHSKGHLRFDSNRVEPMKGLDRYRAYIVGFADAFPDLHIEVVRAFGQGDMVCDEHITSGTHNGPMQSSDGITIPPSGKRFKVRNCHIYKIEAGKIVETWRYLDQLVFLTQLDLVPKEAS